MNNNTPRRYLFVVDDGWRYETQEVLRYLNSRADFDIVTHDPSTYEKLRGEFRISQLEIFPLKGRIAYTILMFFARELDTQLMKTAWRIRFHKSSPAKKILMLIREMAGKIGLRRYRYTRVLEFLYRNSTRYTEHLKGHHALIYSSVSTIDKRVIYEARRQRIKILCWVFSWDHPMKDNEFLPDADRYFVWNRETLDSLRCLHGIKPEIIDIVGPAQFDYLLEDRQHPHWPPPERYVVFACSLGMHSFHIGQEANMILLVRHVLDRVDPTVKLVVRPYPFAMSEDPYPMLRGRDNIEVFSFGTFEERKMLISRKDLDDKFEQMWNAACYITIGSTIALEVSFTRTPILQLNFNMSDSYPDWQDYREILKNDHLRFIIDPDHPNTIHNESELERALGDILSGRANSYMAYSRKLQRFAHPLRVSSYKSVLCEKLLAL